MKPRAAGLRLWIEILAGVAAAVACAVTVAVPDWIERLTGLDPDGGNGDTEWGIVAMLAAVSLTAFVLAWRSWRIVRTQGVSANPR